VRRFSKADPRISSVVTDFDPRVHFALACGTKSCPLVRVYNANDLDKQLAETAHHYCTSTTKVIADLKQVTLTAFFVFCFLFILCLFFGPSSKMIGRFS